MDKEISYDLDLHHTYEKIGTKKIFICCYAIVNKRENPYVTYLLYKYQENDNLFFLTFDYKGTTESVAEYIKTYTNELPKIKGYSVYNNNTYIFCQINIDKIIQNKHSTNESLWWVTMNEICNDKMVLYFNIDKSVSDLFLYNRKLIYLFNEKNVKYEIPRIGYYGCYSDLIPYVTSLGVKQRSNAPFGNFFYFTSYVRAVRYGGWVYDRSNEHIKFNKDGVFDRGGVVRFAVFLKKNRMMLDNPNDQKNLFNNDLEILKRLYKKFPRIVDIGGQWAKKNDSIYIGELIDKKYKKTYHSGLSYQYVLKNINDYSSLSSHELETSEFGKIWEITGNYLIK